MVTLSFSLIILLLCVSLPVNCYQNADTDCKYMYKDESPSKNSCKQKPKEDDGWCFKNYGSDQGMPVNDNPYGSCDENQPSFWNFWTERAIQNHFDEEENPYEAPMMEDLDSTDDDDKNEECDPKVTTEEKSDENTGANCEEDDEDEDEETPLDVLAKETKRHRKTWTRRNYRNGNSEECDDEDDDDDAEEEDDNYKAHRSAVCLPAKKKKHEKRKIWYSGYKTCEANKAKFAQKCTTPQKCSLPQKCSSRKKPAKHITSLCDCWKLFKLSRDKCRGHHRSGKSKCFQREWKTTGMLPKPKPVVLNPSMHTLAKRTTPFKREWCSKGWTNMREEGDLTKKNQCEPKPKEKCFKDPAKMGYNTKHSKGCQESVKCETKCETRDIQKCQTTEEDQCGFSKLFNMPSDILKCLAIKLMADFMF